MPMFNAVIQLPERGGAEYYVFAGSKVAVMQNETKGYDKLIQGPKSIWSDCPIPNNDYGIHSKPLASSLIVEASE